MDNRTAEQEALVRKSVAHMKPSPKKDALCLQGLKKTFLTTLIGLKFLLYRQVPHDVFHSDLIGNSKHLLNMFLNCLKPAALEH
jgi:hypothetical protein